MKKWQVREDWNMYVAIRHALVAAFLIGAPSGAYALDIPTCTIRIIVSGPAGGTPDLIARLGAAKLASGLGRTVVVENQSGGAAAVTSINTVKNAQPNGCTLMAANASIFSISPTLYSKPLFDPADFLPISVNAISPNVLIVNPKLPVKNLAELIALVKSEPDKINFGSGGLGTPMHLYGAMLASRFGFKLNHVPYRGSAQVVADLISNQVQFTFEQFPTFIAQVETGNVRPLAVAGAARSAVMPGLPTLIEEGVTGADAVSWFGLVAPRGTPKDFRDAYAQVLNEGMRDPEVTARLKLLGAEAMDATPDKMQAWMDSQLAKWSPLVKTSGVVIDQ